MQSFILRGLMAATIAFGLGGPAVAEPVDISDAVAAAGSDPASSTMIVKRLSNGQTWIANPGRASTPFSPASTSKIPHTLIALETGAADLDRIFPWDGEERWLAVWNRDQTLDSAYRVSAVWVYQALAREQGHAVMSGWLDRLGYGNREIGGPEDLTRYWLNGQLKISAAEQIDFLSRLALGTVPLAPETLAAGREIMQAGQGADWTLYAKTGWHYNETEMDIGWYVGWVERAGDHYAFAFNLDMPTRETVPQRKETALAVLRAIEVLPKAAD